MTKLAQRLGIPRYEADRHYAAALRFFVGRNHKPAHAEIESAIELLPNHAEYRAAHGFFLLEDKQHKRAEEAFALALQLNPYEMLANYGCGMLAYRAKEWQSAAEYFLTALAAQPKRAETQYFLSMTYHRLGRNDEALRWMEHAGAGFTRAEDKRERQCAAWIREFEKLLPENQNAD